MFSPTRVPFWGYAMFDPTAISALGGDDLASINQETGHFGLSHDALMLGLH